MKILHISDFHLSNDDVSIQKSQIIVNSLIEALDRVQQDKTIDLVIFSGDAINKGGAGFDSLEDAFLSFQTILIEPLMAKLNLSKDKFVWCIGNHDIDRNLDSKYLEAGINEKLKTLRDVDDFFNNNDGMDVKRLAPFKKYEKEFYVNKINNSYKYGYFESCFKYKIEGKLIGVCCLNTAWRCWNSNKDKGHILLGREQLSRAADYLNDCDVKIAVSHHDYQWMADFEINEIDKMIVADFDLYFSGHTHSINAELCIKPQGKTFKVVASGILSHNIYEQDNYQNSFSVIDYDMENWKFMMEVYVENHNMFVLSSDKSWEYPIPIGEDKMRMMDIHNIKTDLKDESKDLNEHLLSYKTETTAPRSLNDIFVMPTIVRQKDLSDKDDIENTEEIVYDVKELIQTKDNFIVFGIKECGKTILLDKIRIEVLSGSCLEDYLPISLDFRSIKNNKDILNRISEFWHCRKQTTINCLNESQILLLVDNISFSQSHVAQLEAIRDFLNDYHNVRFIGASREERCSDIITESDQHKLLDFIRLEIRQFDSHQIRELVKKWFPQEKYNSEKVEDIIKMFSKLNLPRTPFSISMLLWILERQNVRPQNTSLLVETYLIELMKSRDNDVAGRNTFDYKHKLNLLAEIAHKMLSSKELNYKIVYSEYLAEIEKFLEVLNFKSIYSAKNIANQFIDMGIFVQENDGVYFRFECFFEFCLAKAMQRNKEFREFIVSEENYLKYADEIIYYTGICRNEHELLQLIVDRMEKDYSEMKRIVFGKNNRIDDIFNVNESIMNKMTADDLINSLPSKETEEESDKRGDIMLRHNCDGNGEVKRKPEGNNVIINLSKQLLLAMNVFKNSEEITIPNLKSETYVRILKYSIAYCLLAKLKKTKKLLEERDLPKERIKDMHIMLRFLPFLHQKLLSRNLDTVKISEIIKQKIDADKQDVSISELEKYMSIFLYSDIQPNKARDDIKGFLHTSNRAYIHDACYMNLLDSYYRSTSDDYDDFLIKMIAELYFGSSSHREKAMNKGIFIQNLRNKKLNKLR